MAIYRRDIRQVTKASASTGKIPTKEEELLALLRTYSREELQKFILDYSKEQPGLHDALQDFLLPSESSGGYPDYDKLVKELLETESDAIDDYNKKHYNPLDHIVNELNRLIWKAEHYAGKDQYKEALDIALAVLEQVALAIDDVYDHDGELVFLCNDAESIVEEIVKSDIPHPLLHATVSKLKELGKIDNFEAYGLADIDFLLLFAKIKTSEADKALQLLSSAIEEENNPFRCTEMVKTMLNILHKEGRSKEYHKTVEKYQFLPDIMKIRYESLASKKDWAGILQMLERSIADADRENRRGDVINLKESKLQVYQLMNDPENILEVAIDLFYTGSEPMVQYHLLKKTVPIEEWPNRTNFSNRPVMMDELKRLDYGCIS